MPPAPTPGLTFQEMRILVQRNPISIAKKLFYLWACSDILSEDEFYILFDELRARIV